MRQFQEKQSSSHTDTKPATICTICLTASLYYIQNILYVKAYSGVEGEGDVLVVSGGGEGDLRQSEVILGAGQRGVQHQHIALEKKEKRQP